MARRPRTGFRPVNVGDHWALDHPKPFWRDAAARIRFDTRDAAEAWITDHVRRLGRVARPTSGRR